ncbi:MAG: hypothetical protein UR99_C0005G0002 [Candidatus Moranbacteria bacterium GW2011_GWD2_36_12]|nr:MAG: hypothetical protein UR99_C0005G0002 [Candidatus Moranbacteria bacterium GW2011_GWD2_36_12]KKQ06986.1 MAG: hypothetical protein US16_C0004G0002 [Candidatus Moranbacteria bacterium GW2011_GWE2_36_40]
MIELNLRPATRGKSEDFDGAELAVHALEFAFVDEVEHAFAVNLPEKLVERGLKQIVLRMAVGTDCPFEGFAGHIFHEKTESCLNGALPIIDATSAVHIENFEPDVQRLFHTPCGV